MSTLTIKAANAITGGLSKPSKMPGRAYNLPPQECKVGSLLRQIKGSTCSKCYAFRGHYMYGVVRKSMYGRLASITDPQWVDAMATLIAKQSPLYFRWHDSGDLQSMEHLQKIVEVCRLTPSTKHWLPTREAKLLQEYYASYKTPLNLVIRYSMPMVGQPPSHQFPHTSTVVVKKSEATCPAHSQGNECGDCRRCWNPRITNISYPKH